MLTHLPLPKTLILAALAGAIVGGCADSKVQRATGLTPGADMVKVDADAPYVPGSPVAIDIENPGGDVLVVVDAALTMPQIRATSMHEGDNQGAAPWAAATLAPSGVAATQAAPILRVLAADVSGAKHRTSLEVRVPACAGVRVRNQDGAVTLQGVGGAIDVQNGSPLSPGGSITLLTDATLDAPLLLETASGPIRVEFPASSRLNVDASSRNGAVTVQATGVRLGQVSATKQSWSAAINGGDAPARISTESGDITLRLKR